MKRSAQSSKERKTYTLSSEALTILENERKERHLSSASAALEELLKERRQQREMADFAASVTRYYDSLSEEEIEQDRCWGEFAARNFPQD